MIPLYINCTLEYHTNNIMQRFMGNLDCGRLYSVLARDRLSSALRWRRMLYTLRPDITVGVIKIDEEMSKCNRMFLTA